MSSEGTREGTHVTISVVSRSGRDRQTSFPTAISQLGAESRGSEDQAGRTSLQHYVGLLAPPPLLLFLCNSVLFDATDISDNGLLLGFVCCIIIISCSNFRDISTSECLTDTYFDIAPIQPVKYGGNYTHPPIAMIGPFTIGHRASASSAQSTTMTNWVGRSPLPRARGPSQIRKSRPPSLPSSAPLSCCPAILLARF